MAAPKRFNKDKRPKRNTQSLLFKRKRFCRFTVANVEEVDYKDVDVLRDFIAENGVADRVEAQACNFTRDPFPADCDVAIMASNLPMYGRDGRERWLVRADADARALLVDVELTPCGQIFTRPFVF